MLWMKTNSQLEKLLQWRVQHIFQTWYIQTKTIKLVSILPFTMSVYVSVAPTQVHCGEGGLVPALVHSFSPEASLHMCRSMGRPLEQRQQSTHVTDQL